MLNCSMIRLAAAALCAGLSGVALAQVQAPTVTLYGTADGGFTRTTGLAGGKNAVVSGIMDGSRFGLKGDESLGGGYRALFTLENRIELDTGAMGNRAQSGTQTPDRFSQVALLNQAGSSALPTSGVAGQFVQSAVTSVAAAVGSTIGVNLDNRSFDRQAWVGLVTPVGGFMLGRQYTPAYETGATFDILGTSSALSAAQVATLPAGFDIRVDNALQYRVVQGGFTGSLMVAPGEVSTNAKARDFAGAMLRYQNESFGIGLAYNERHNDVGQKSLRNVVLGASKSIGATTLNAMMVTIRDDNPSGVSTIATQTAALSAVNAALPAAVQSAFTNALKQDARLYHLGYKLSKGAHTVYTAYNVYDDRRPANADVRSYGAVYLYALSKRTDISGQVVRFVNGDLAQAAPGQIGYLGGVTRSAGTDSTVIAAGIRHRF